MKKFEQKPEKIKPKPAISKEKRYIRRPIFSRLVSDEFMIAKNIVDLPYEK